MYLSMLYIQTISKPRQITNKQVVETRILRTSTKIIFTIFFTTFFVLARPLFIHQTDCDFSLIYENEHIAGSICYLLTICILTTTSQIINISFFTYYNMFTILTLTSIIMCPIVTRVRRPIKKGCFILLLRDAT